MSDLNKKVKWMKKDGNADSCDNAGNVYVISDEKNPPPPKSQDNIKDQQQSNNLSVCVCV